MIAEIFTNVFLILGVVFCIASIIGMVRMPEYYCRCHACGVTETLGIMFPCIGLMINCGFSSMSVKLLIVFVFVFLYNPLGTHAISRAAYFSGHKVWKRKEK